MTKGHRKMTTCSGFTFSPEFPVIIALQGDPYTGKTTLANSLAENLKCLVIRFDEIIDVISSHEPQPPTPKRAETLMSNAFDIITQIAKTHTSFGNSVVIDSPLSRRSHLNKLVNFILQLPFVPGIGLEDQGRVLLVLLQCKPKTEYAWQMRFEEHDFSLYQNKWYKPKNSTWPMDPVFSRDYGDNDIHPIVSKLVVDTTDYVPLDSLFGLLSDLSMQPEGSSFELGEWISIGGYDGVNLDGKRTLEGMGGQPCTRAHLIREYWEEGVDYDATCEVCEKEVNVFSGPTYSCIFCPSTIHKACGELESMEFTPNNFPKFHIQDGSFCYPEEHLCTRCKQTGNGFSYECDSCVFQCHLKCKLVPTIMNHPGHDHRLFFRLTSFNVYEYLCSACKHPGKHVGYSCLENCEAHYHPECALLPRVFRDHEHSGHKHDLEMVFSRDEEMEDYMCDMCLDKMNPKAWYYYCHNCDLPLHLDCAFKDFDA